MPSRSPAPRLLSGKRFPGQSMSFSFTCSCLSREILFCCFRFLFVSLEILNPFDVQVFECRSSVVLCSFVYLVVTSIIKTSPDKTFEDFLLCYFHLFLNPICTELRPSYLLFPVGLKVENCVLFMHCFLYDI
jgi:hypothetical protein